MSSFLPCAEIVAAYDSQRLSVSTPTPSRATLGAAVAYSLVGTALGVLAGTAFAMATLNAPLSASVPESTPAAQMAGSVADRQMAPPISSRASQTVLASVQLPAVLKVARTKPHAGRVSLRITRHHLRLHRRMASRTPLAKPALLPLTAQAGDAPPSSAATPPAIAIGARHFTFFSEGDVTVADFDGTGTGGKIETYEGSTFTLADASAPGNAGSWEGAGSSLHYRCDQSGSCTLMGSGITIQNAKLLRL